MGGPAFPSWSPAIAEFARPGRPPTSWRLVLALLCLGGAGLLAYLLTEQFAGQSLVDRASGRLDVVAAEIDGILGSGSNLPSALAVNDDVVRILREPGAASALQAPVNRFLESINNHLGSLNAFVVDRAGVVRGSSDWSLSENLVGQDMAAQPFFRMALNGSRYGYYATDPVRREPGFYFSQPIVDPQAAWSVVGVAVVKVSLNDLQRRWLNHELPVLVADASGVVILSTVPEWRYTVIAPSGQSPGGDLQPRFDGRELRPFPAPLDGLASGVGQRVRLRLLVDSGPARAGGKEYFVLGRAMPGTGWQLAVFSDYLPVRRQAMAGAVFAVLLAGGLILLAVFIAQRRRLARVQGEARRLLEAANQALEQRVAERTADLVAVNSRLRQEIHERERAEQTLRAAQDELVQAAKLAVLGRMAAGITHELNQPLGAMRTLAANAVAYMQRGDTRTAENNLSIVGQQIDQMARIIGPLKSFARKSPAVAERVDLAQAVDKALFLFDKRLAGIQLDKQWPAAGAVAWCDGNRLQQVLVNLIGNALDALAASAQPCLRLRARCVGAHVFLEVADNGPGLSAAALAHLFEPFFSTKGSGEGLGLGLTISRDIVRDFGGDLSGGNGPDGGALFTLRLPKAKEES